MSTTHPIETVLPDIRTSLINNRSLIIQAPPGAGKTTCVPLALLNESWLKTNKIIMLEPRRLAARASAYRMAEMLEEVVGKTVGYHIRNDRKSGPETRIEVVTEGILTRRLQYDPALEGVGAVIFDEFHERNLNSDLGLALILEAMEAIRDDLRLLVMSATLDAAPVSELLGNAPVINSEGYTWPVEILYRPVSKIYRGRFPVETECANAVISAIGKDEGDILAFLPGAGEIKRVASMLRDSISDERVTIYRLFGALSKKDQDLAIRPSRPGYRKVVLATSIAETSLTIQGVRIVIDSGLARSSRFSPGSGMSRLVTYPASEASTDQRKGRAGRTGPGVCYRIWDKAGQTQRQAFTPPEILTADLTGFALELAVWGVTDPKDLRWLDQPPEGSFKNAVELLKHLGALDELGKATQHGKELATLGLHPRLGHMILKAKEMDAGRVACRIAAILEERDFLIFRDQYRDADFRLRLECIDAEVRRKRMSLEYCHVNQGILHRILDNIKSLERKIKAGHETVDNTIAGPLLAFAYPERIAKARPGGLGEFHMASGSGAFLSVEDPLASEMFLVAAELDGNRKKAKIYLAAPYSEALLEKDFGHLLSYRETVRWDNRLLSVIAKKECCYGKIVLREELHKDIDPDLIIKTMTGGIASQGISVLPWSKSLRNWQARVVFLKKTGGCDDLPDISDSALTETISKWLGPFLSNISSLKQVKSSDIESALRAMLSWEQLTFVDVQAPTHIRAPSGSNIPLSYCKEDGSVADSPVLAVRLQEMFGLRETPSVANGKIPVTLHLLSPAGRPMQVTRDLKSFWENTYHDVKKDLKGRYPKHYWPDDPFNAVATNRTKKGMAGKG